MLTSQNTKISTHRQPPTESDFDTHSKPQSADALPSSPSLSPRVLAKTEKASASSSAAPRSPSSALRRAQTHTAEVGSSLHNTCSPPATKTHHTTSAISEEESVAAHVPYQGGQQLGTHSSPSPAQPPPLQSSSSSPVSHVGGMTAREAVGARVARIPVARVPAKTATAVGANNSAAQPASCKDGGGGSAGGGKMSAGVGSSEQSKMSGGEERVKDQGSSAGVVNPRPLSFSAERQCGFDGL